MILSRMRVEKLNAAIDDIKIAIANAPLREMAVQAATTQASQEGPVDPRIIAMNDNVMRAYMEAEERAQDRVNSLDRFPSTNPNVIAANEALKKAHQKVTEYAELYRLFHKVTSQNLNDPLRSGVAPVSVDMLKASLAILEDAQAKTNKAMIRNGPEEPRYPQEDRRGAGIAEEV